MVVVASLCETGEGRRTDATAAARRGTVVDAARWVAAGEVINGSLGLVGNIPLDENAAAFGVSQ